MPTIIKDTVDDEIICTDRPEDFQSDARYKVLGEDRAPLDGEMYVEGVGWVQIVGLSDVIEQSEWNSLPSAVRGYLFQVEIRLRAMEQFLLGDTPPPQ